MFGRAGARDAGAQQSYATYILIMTTASGALCPQIKALRRVVLRTRVSGPGTSQLGAVPNEASRTAATRTGAKASAAPSDIHAKLKARQAVAQYLGGQERPFLRQWARSALRSGRRSAWASPCAATHVPPRLSGNLGKPRRSGRRRGLRAARGVLSHRRDLISGARRRSRHRRDLISDAAEPHYTQKR